MPTLCVRNVAVACACHTQTYRELYKVLRHNPDILGIARPKPKARPPRRVEQLCDVIQLRQRVMMNASKLELPPQALHCGTRARLDAVQNPTIGYTSLVDAVDTAMVEQTTRGI